MSDHLLLSVERRVAETSDVITLYLKPLHGEVVRYLAGQFLTFIFEIRGRALRRSYSLSSSPAMDTFLSVTIKRIPNGEVSTYIWNNIKEGDIIKSLSPAGRFVPDVESDIQKDVFLIAAGSGIVPVYSILKTLLIIAPWYRITLIYSNRSEATTIFYKEIKALEGIYSDRFTCIHILSDSFDKSHPYRAHLNMGLLERLIKNKLHFEWERAEFFICGPFSFMRMADTIIVVMGFPAANVHKEQFIVLVEPPAVRRIPDIPDKLLVILYKENAIEISAAYNMSILELALTHGIRIPYSCKAGICGSCAVSCLSGKVFMSLNEVLTETDLESGLVLTCTGYVSDKKVVIKV